MAQRSESIRTAGNLSSTRCAIYTRKSSEEGLDQSFNSLDAQRETCEAYIASQKHEGWIALPRMYDDGGISGGTMDRPALKRLLHDIASDRIDTVVVYKVDRLTRSLADFAKIVDIFEANDVTFVSVTQSFNTTTSMGRLTLNMLLSFAQFEREVAGERIREKIAASKRQGMWMGGHPPLGYDVAERKLVVNGPDTARPPEPDPGLLRILGLAHRFRTMVLHGDGASIAELAGQANVDPSYFTRILKLSFLSPDIAATILDGLQPAVLNARRLTQAAGQLAIDWDEKGRQISVENRS